MHNIPRVADADRPQRLVVISKSVHVNQPGSGYQKRKHITEGHGHQHHIRRCAHVPLAEHHHYEGVSYDGNHQQVRHGVAVQRNGVLQRRIAGHVHVQTRAGLVGQNLQDVGYVGRVRDRDVGHLRGGRLVRGHPLRGENRDVLQHLVVSSHLRGLRNHSSKLDLGAIHLRLP